MDRTFAYRVPPELSAAVQPGMRVLVPFASRELIGWIDEAVDRAPAGVTEIREILDLPDEAPVLDAELLALCRWVARYYVAPLGLVFRAALPSVLSAESGEVIRWAGAEHAADALTPLEAELAAFLRARRGPVRMSTIRRALGRRHWWPTVRRLAARGLVRTEWAAPETSPPVLKRTVVRLARELPSLLERDRVFGRARRQRAMFEYLESVGGSAELGHLTTQLGFHRSVVHGLVKRGLVHIADEAKERDPFATETVAAEAAPVPTEAQRAAIAAILEASQEPSPGVFVLQGVTGSGKTLVYIEVLKEIVLRRGHSAIVLVPEISLTPQTVARFRAAFGDRIAVLHSALGEGERYDAWCALREGRKAIAVGARSAIFAPARGLGAIILDEEHEPTYKQNEPAPRYHAREVAVVRARAAGGVCVLGSATPSLEAWARARAGTWRLLRLPARVGERPLPPVRIVDLREERRRLEALGAAGGPVILSEPLVTAIAECLHRGEQAILLLNRRGYASFIQCRACGHVRTCPNCNVSLTYHRRPEHLLCHHCSHTELVPAACPNCGSNALAFAGVGTQHVEQVLAERFARARIARMDVDTTSRKWAHHDILGRVERREIDILFGTQMIAKGLDFPNVTVVGVINADVAIHLPDFRASERTFQLLTQVAGRAGRGPRGGRVIIQTALPNHYALHHAAAHDYDAFAERESRERLEPWYPPHCLLANTVFSGLEETETAEVALEAAQWLQGLVERREIAGIRVVGPAPAPLARIRNRYRWHCLLKSEEGKNLGAVLRYFARRFRPSHRGVRVQIDRDPASLL
ncbi:MAG: primosomal protein N' [Gemmatimonadetes bacterium]|nr:primosomal protein N' [Gemmatimonadota bacterium]